MGKIIQMQDEILKDLLNEAFYKWCLENPKVSNLVEDASRLIVYEGNHQVVMDLRQFPDYFIRHYFTNKPQVFSNTFARKLEQTVFKTISSIGLSEFEIEYNFKYFGIHTSSSIMYYMHSRMN